MIDTLNDNLQTIYNELMTKLIPENLRSGVNLLNVTGTLEEGDVKLFETQEEMRADTTAKEGDLAIVYRNEVQNATVDSRFQTATFPDTVVLDTAITDYIEVRYRAVDSSKMFDCMGQLNSSRFSMDCYTDSGSLRIQYTSEDGVTYTRTDTVGNSVDFGTEIYYERPEMWNDAIGKFIQIGGGTFEGLYEYKAFKNKNKIHIYSYSELAWDNSTSKLTGTGGEVIEFDIEATLNKITEYTETNFSDYRTGTYYDNPIYEYMLYYDNNCIVFPFATQNEETPYKFLHNLNLLIDNTSWKATGGIIRTYPSETYNLHEIRVNITTGQLSYELLEENFTNETYQPLARFNNYKFVGNINKDGVFNYEYQNNLTTILYYSTKDSTWYESNCIYGEKPGIDDIKYLFADTQLNATPGYVYEKEFYGKNGAGTGTLTQDISNSFNDTNAELYNKIQNQYESMEPRILTDSDKTIDTSIYCIPVKRDGTPLLDTSKVTNMSSMFSDCSNLTTIPLLNTSSVTDMFGMFSSCKNLTEISLLDTSNVTNMNSMFSDCRNLTTIPKLNTSKVTNMYFMFSGCTNLTTISLLDTSTTTNMTSMFLDCPNLSDDSLNNILAMCKNATSYTSTKTLKYIGITSEQATKCTTLSNYSAFTSAGWTTGY